MPWKKNVNPLLEVVKKLACRVDEFREVRRNAFENDRINSDKLNSQLKEKGINNNSMMPLVGVGFPDFEGVLEFLWRDSGGVIVRNEQVSQKASTKMSQRIPPIQRQRRKS